MEHYIRVQCFIPATSSVPNVDTLTLFPAAIQYPKIETEDYLQQSVGVILAILSNPKTQIPFLTYGETAASTVESISKLLQHTISRAPPATHTPDPTPTPEQKIPVPKQSPTNVLTIIPTMPTVPVQVHRAPIVRPTSHPVQVQRVPLKYPGGKTTPPIKSMPPQPVRPILNT